MLTAKKGISSLQVHRVVFGENSGSDWRTSWYTCMRWRAAMRGEMYKLEGVVEVDESYMAARTATGLRARGAPICARLERPLATPRSASSAQSRARVT
jgi:hypothetical protein